MLPVASDKDTVLLCCLPPGTRWRDGEDGWSPLPPDPSAATSTTEMSKMSLGEVAHSCTKDLQLGLRADVCPASVPNTARRAEAGMSSINR